jgi:hypothetical protein
MNMSVLLGSVHAALSYGLLRAAAHRLHAFSLMLGLFLLVGALGVFGEFSSDSSEACASVP